jgi:circadian clock protein KaiB
MASPTTSKTKTASSTHAPGLEKTPTSICGLTQGDQIVAVPTLVRRLPTPVKKIIGDLSNAERILVAVDLRPAEGWR